MEFKKTIQIYQDLITRAIQWVNGILALFALAALIGFFAFYSDKTLIQVILEYFKGLVGKNQTSDWELVGIIFKQNLFASFIAMFGGILFGIPSTFIVLVNGFLFGYVIHFLFAELSGNFLSRMVTIAIVILPHGIFELSIVLTAAAFGLRWGIGWIFPIAKGKRLLVWKEAGRDAFSFVPVLLIFLVFAAILEVFVSAKLSEWLLPGK